MASTTNNTTCSFCGEDDECLLRIERKLEGKAPFIVCEECDCAWHSANYNGWANKHYWCECDGDDERFIKKTEANKGKWGFAKPTIHFHNPLKMSVCKECAFDEVERCDNCGETEDLIITEDLITCEACDPACYKCGDRSWKWSIELCERLDETSGWNEGLYCMKCIEESETVEGKPAKDEEEDEDSEDEVGVDEIEFEGTTYWVGEDNTVYGGTMTDPLAVGTWNADEKRIIFH